jgi:hypothetical protein
MKRSTKRFLGLALLGLVAAAFALYGAFGSISVCGTCGAVQDSTEWQIPFTSVTYWHSTSITQTPLSAVVAKRQLAACPPHNWLFIHGGGNGILCAIGDGRRVHQAALSPNVAAFVSAVTEYQGQREGQRWLKMALDPEASGEVLSLLAGDVPQSGFADRTTFERWWKQQRDVVDTLLSEPHGRPTKSGGR